jgi:hypothetical protein
LHGAFTGRKIKRENKKAAGFPDGLTPFFMVQSTFRQAGYFYIGDLAAGL